MLTLEHSSCVLSPHVTIEYTRVPCRLQPQLTGPLMLYSIILSHTLFHLLCYCSCFYLSLIGNWMFLDYRSCNQLTSPHLKSSSQILFKLIESAFIASRGTRIILHSITLHHFLFILMKTQLVLKTQPRCVDII